MSDESLFSKLCSIDYEDFRRYPDPLIDPNRIKDSNIESSMSLEERIAFRTKVLVKRLSYIKQMHAKQFGREGFHTSQFVEFNSEWAYNRVKQNFTFKDEHGNVICFLKDLDCRPASEIPPGDAGEVFRQFRIVVSQLEDMKRQNLEFQKQIDALKASPGIDAEIMEAIKMLVKFFNQGLEQPFGMDMGDFGETLEAGKYIGKVEKFLAGAK